MSQTLFDGLAMTVEVGFAGPAGGNTIPINSTLASIQWSDVTEYVRNVSTNRGRSTELDTYSAGTCSVLFDNRTRVFDPEHGPSYVGLTGVSGNYLSTPSATLFNGGTNYDIRVRCEPTAWVNGVTVQTFMAKSGASVGNLSWRFTIGGGLLQWWFSTNGTSWTTVNSTTAVGFSAGDSGWVRVTRNKTTGVVTFYTAPDSPIEPTTWTQLGSPVTSSTATIFSSAAAVEVGSVSVGTTGLFTGNVYRALFSTTIGGTAQADFDSSRIAADFSTPPAGVTATISSVTGETWTAIGTTVFGISGQRGGPYYGALTPLRPIRIRVTPSGGTIRTIFTGFVDQWPQSYVNPNDALVAVTASDAFKVLNNYKLPSYWDKTVRAASPTRWYPLVDFAGSFYAFETVKWSSNSAQWMSNAAGVTSSCTTGQSLLIVEPATSSSFDGTKILQINDSLGVYLQTANASAWTVEFWMSTTLTTTGNYGIWNHGNFIHGGSCGLVVSGGNAQIVAQFGHRGTSSTMTTKNVPINVNDGKPHHVALVYQSDASFGNTFNLYVDGVLATVSGSFTDTVDNGYSFMTLGYPINKSATASNNFPNYFQGSIQHLVVYSGTLLSDAEILKHYQVGVGTYLQDQTTDARIQLLLDLISWPSDGTTLGSGQSTVLGIQTTGKGILDALKECEVAEQGRLFMSPTGTVKFVNRSAFGSGNSVNSQAMFGDTSGFDLRYSDITLTYDDRFVFNDVTVQQPGGSSYKIVDSTSQNQYFTKTKSTDAIVSSAYLMVNMATNQLSNYSQPKMRIDSLTLDGRGHPTKQDLLTTLDIGDRVSVTRTPKIGQAIQKQLFIEGITHQFTPKGWQMIFTFSPTFAGPFVLDSPLLGVLDVNTLGY